TSRHLAGSAWSYQHPYVASGHGARGALAGRGADGRLRRRKCLYGGVVIGNERQYCYEKHFSASPCIVRSFVGGDTLVFGAGAGGGGSGRTACTRRGGDHRRFPQTAR